MLGVPVAPDYPQGADIRKTVKRTKKKNGKEKEKHFEGWGSTPSLQKLHDLAVWLRNSTIHLDLWMHTIGVTLGIDNDTRWISWYQVICKAIKHKDKIIIFLATNADALEDKVLTSYDWETLEQTYTFLKFFEEATLMVEGDEASLHRSIQTLDGILAFFEEQKVYKLSLFSFIIYQS